MVRRAAYSGWVWVIPMLIDNLTNFQFGNYRITNFEMETSAIYGLGNALGIIA